MATSRDDSTSESASSLLSEWSIRQRAGLAIAAAVVLIGLCWSVWSPAPADLVPLAIDGPLTPQLARELRTKFHEAGLSEFQQSGDQILVPRAEQDQYSAVLPSPPQARDWAAEWEHQNESLTLFSGSRALEANREIARAKLIAGLLRQLPDIEHADIVWDEDESPGWRTSARTRATVYLDPQPDRVLTLDVIRAVRLAVAGSKKNLAPDDVVVMDLARQVTYEGQLPQTVGGEVLPQLRSLAEMYRREIREQIRELSHADIAVGIDLPRFLESIAAGQGEPAIQSEMPPSRLTAIAPSLMRVNVTLPRDSGVSVTEAENVCRLLQDQIVQVTGIGTDNRQEQVVVRFDRQAADGVTKAQESSWGNRMVPAVERMFLNRAVGIFLVVIATSLLGWLVVRWRRRSAPSPPSTTIPAFHAVDQRARQLNAGRAVGDFEDLARLNAHHIRLIYSQLTPKCWAVALRGATTQTGDQIAAALGPAAIGELQQFREQLGPVTIGDIQSAQNRILETWDTLHAPAV